MIICFLNKLDKDYYPNFTNNKLKKIILRKSGCISAGYVVDTV